MFDNNVFIEGSRQYCFWPLTKNVKKRTKIVHENLLF